MDDEECREFTGEKDKDPSSASPKKSLSPRYYVECLEEVEESSMGVPDWMHPGWQHLSCYYVKMKYVVKGFREFVTGDEKWRKEFSWALKTRGPKVFIPLYIFTFVCLFAGFGHYLFGLSGGENGLLFKILGVVFLYFSIRCWVTRNKPITPWGAGGDSGAGAA